MSESIGSKRRAVKSECLKRRRGDEEEKKRRRDGETVEQEILQPQLRKYERRSFSAAIAKLRDLRPKSY